MTKGTPDSPGDANDLFLRPGLDSVEIRGKLYHCESRLCSPNGYVFVDAEAPDISVPITNNEIWRQHGRGELRFVPTSAVVLPKGAKAALTRPLAVRSDRQASNIQRRLKYMRAIDKVGQGPCEENWQPICDRVARELGEPSQHWKTHYRWWLLWTKSGRNPKVLAGNEAGRGNRKSRLTEIQQAAIDKGRIEWDRKGRPRVSTAHSAVNAAIVKAHGGSAIVEQMIEENRSPLVSYNTVSKRVQAGNRSVHLSRRYGGSRARQEMKPVFDGPKTDLPLGRVEADFKYLGLMIIDDKTGLPLGTPYIMAGVDCFSGSAAGFDVSFDPPSAASAARGLAHIIKPKQFENLLRDQQGGCVVRRDWPINGVPKTFYLDNDAVFHAMHLEMSASAMGCDVLYLEPGLPNHKGTIESLWRTVTVSFTDMFPGRVLRISEKPDPDYKPENYAVVTLRELRTFLTFAFVHVFNQTVHEPSGEIRIERYRAAASKHPPQPVPPHDDILELVGVYETGTADRKGIRLPGLRYNSNQLAAYRDTFPEDPEVRFRYTPDDLGEVVLVDVKRSITFPVPCVDQEYARGLTLYQHNLIRNRAADKGDNAKPYRHRLMLAKAELFQLAQDLLENKKSRKARQQLARFLGAELPDRPTRQPVQSDECALSSLALPWTPSETTHAPSDDEADATTAVSTHPEFERSSPVGLQEDMLKRPASNKASLHYAAGRENFTQDEALSETRRPNVSSAPETATKQAPEQNEMQLIKIRRSQR